MTLILRFLFNILGLWLSAAILNGFQVSGGWKGYLTVGLILVLLNMILKPVLKLVAFPLIIVSLGLFVIVINALILWLTGQITDFLLISDTLTLLWATLIISATNLITNKISK